MAHDSGDEMRPVLKFLDAGLIAKIVDEACAVLEKIGIEIHNEPVTRMLTGQGAAIGPDGQQVKMPRSLVERSIAAAPKSFRLYDVLGNQTHDFAGNNVYFTPGSAALNILDSTGRIRRPRTEDYIAYARLVGRLENIASQSTAFIPADVHGKISDSYRLYLSLRYCEKPVITGAFTVESFAVMKAMQVAVRGSEKNLKAMPLTVFSCCPTAPLKWSNITSQNLVDCARSGIPVEIIAMPLAGFMAPVTIVGTLIQHTAETLSGIVISQAASPGAPVLYGGSPAVFDVRYETTPMGAIETQLIDCAYSEIGKHFGLPTQAYISLSDAKLLDAQAGLESAAGAVLAGLAGINNVSGPGMLDFESCQSLEKLVVDNEICGMVLHMLKGIEPKEDFPSLPLFEELLKNKHLLTSRHTRKFFKTEHYMPGRVIDRANRSRWQDEGAKTIIQRAGDEVKRLIGEDAGSRLDENIKRELTRLMTAEAKRFGMDGLPPSLALPGEGG